MQSPWVAPDGRIFSLGPFACFCEPSTVQVHVVIADVPVSYIASTVAASQRMAFRIKTNRHPVASPSLIETYTPGLERGEGGRRPVAGTGLPSFIYNDLLRGTRFNQREISGPFVLA